MQFTVMPFGPSSRANVFDQPTTPGRTVFDSARLSTGSFTVLDVTVTIRPCPVPSRWGRQSAVRRTAETSSSCTAASIDSSSISRAVVRGGPPELLTTMSIPSKASSVLPTSRSRSAGTLTSPRTARAPAGRPRAPGRRAASRTSRRSRLPLRGPRRCRARCADAPQTIAVRPLSSRSTAAERSWRALCACYLCVRTETTSRTAAAEPEAPSSPRPRGGA